MPTDLQLTLLSQQGYIHVPLGRSQFILGYVRWPTRQSVAVTCVPARISRTVRDLGFTIYARRPSMSCAFIMTEQDMLKEMCLAALGQADLKAIGRSRGF